MKKANYTDKQKISFTEKKPLIKKKKNQRISNNLQFNLFFITLVHATLPCQK